MTNYFSASTNGFYSSENQALFEEAGTWPVDAVAVTDEKYTELFDGQTSGKVITADKKGKPVLTDPPLPTTGELLTNAENQREALMAKANAAVTPLQDAVDIGEVTERELASLTAWKKYRVALNRLDLSTAPEITWPEVPDDVA
jgi:hypothetical protein